MAKKKVNSKVVIFSQPYSTKKAGDRLICDSVLAAALVNKGVAHYEGVESTPSEAVDNELSVEPKEKKKNKKTKNK